MDGYASAFDNSGIQSAILALAQSGGVVVNVIQFATNAGQVIGWTQLLTASDITNFATLIGGVARSTTLGGSTDVEDGIKLAIQLLGNNNYEGNRR